MAVSEPYMGALNWEYSEVQIQIIIQLQQALKQENYYQIAETEKSSAASLLAI